MLNLVTITGSSGFVGQNLTKYLSDRGDSISKLSLRNQNWKNNMELKSDAIIHLAGKAHDTSNTSGEEEYFKINRDLTIDLYDKFIKSEIKDFFYFSSVKAVADKVDGILKEDVIGYPITPYGKSKLEAEQYLLSQTLPTGKRLFIIRPCMIHGPGNKGNLNLLYNVVKKGFPWPLASFHNQRSFLSIDNLSFLVKEMMNTQEMQSDIYNFSDDEPISTNGLVNLIAQTLDKKPRFLHIPASFIKAVGKIGDVIPLPLNSERLKKLTESYVVSNDKIKNALGIQYLPTSAEEGLKKTILSFKRL
ncbi:MULTISPECIES: NAD-dependent epimerase/dehydratase family protein [unclassified Sphingobacterium]|uniref:NAD-dependent epimerase/dehydratase family protein n=1 Tax=unclassified Sphingobacterium TaxID=2609468 RepID=UPI0025F82DE3|nr:MULTISPECIES: NAD-dependent epimerase/dehydratase family protein [unclassified Sphingobacterium]